MEFRILGPLEVRHGHTLRSLLEARSQVTLQEAVDRLGIDLEQVEVAGNALVAEGLAEWCPGSGNGGRSLVVTPAGAEAQRRARDEFRDLLARSSFRSPGARRIRRGVRAEDTAWVVAAANRESGVDTAATGTAALSYAELAAQIQLHATIGSLGDDYRQLLRDELVDHIRAELDTGSGQSPATCTAWRTLRNAVAHSHAETRHVLAEVFRDRLRRFAATVSQDEGAGDTMADIVLFRGTELIVGEVKTHKSGGDPTGNLMLLSADDHESMDNAPIDAWLVGATLQEARATGRLRRPVAAWTEQCIAVTGVGHANTDVVADNFRAGRSVVMELGGIPEPDAERVVGETANLAAGQRGTLDQVDRWVFLLRPDGEAVRRCRHAETVTAERSPPASSGQPPEAGSRGVSHERGGG